MKGIVSLVIVCCLLSATWAAEPLDSPQKVAAYLQEISVTVRAGESQGSATAVNRTIDGENVTFLLTAAHVVDGLRKQEEVITPDGDKRVKITFEDCALVQEVRQAGRRVGEWKFDAKVISYDAGEDVAVLEVRKRDFLKESARFYLKEEIPGVGTELFHCGSPGGQDVGANSVTPGGLAQIGRTFPEFTGEFDQATVASLPGSSGGGVFLKDTGEYVGMLTLGLVGQDSFAYYIPMRRISKWAAKSNLAWLLDPGVKPPTREKLESMPIEPNTFNRTDPSEGKSNLYFLISKPPAPPKDKKGLPSLISAL